MENDERVEKLKTFFDNLLKSPVGHDQLAAALAASGLSVFRQVEAQVFPEVTDPVRLANARKGIFLDTETTGVNTMKDKVIQLAMRKFTFDDQGILSLGDVFDRFRDPDMPIPEEVVKLTRITDEDVAGKTLEDAEVRAFVEVDDNPLIVCHNAGFDRKMLERNFPTAGFEELTFDCSYAQIDWSSRGFTSGKLELLALSSGYVYGSHNALNDINVMPYILSQVNGDLGTPFAEMRSKGARGSILLIAQNSSFDSKDKLKERGYRWSADGEETVGIKAWYRVLDNDPEILALEADFLRSEIYKRDVELPAYHLQGDERYSSRKPARKETFRTSEVRSVIEAVSQKSVALEPQGAFGF
ncbi:hypothetical protein KUV57_13060 [Epibacterium sp. DP7N7-1]|nr:hypothetical protein [Epibacterium sp. DP7N7-1]